MRQPPAEIQQSIREEWTRYQHIDIERLRELHPEWRAEIEDWIVGFLIEEAVDLPNEVEDLLGEIMDSDAVPRRRNERAWTRPTRPQHPQHRASPEAGQE